MTTIKQFALDFEIGKPLKLCQKIYDKFGANWSKTFGFKLVMQPNSRKKNFNDIHSSAHKEEKLLLFIQGRSTVLRMTFFLLCTT